MTRTDEADGGGDVDDAYETNDSWQAASQVGPGDHELSLNQLNITSGDVDYHRFMLVNQGTQDGYVNLYLSSPSTGQGGSDLDLALGKLNNAGNFYPATGNWLDVMSRSETNFETISLDGLAPGEHFVVVFGQSGFDLSENGVPDPDFSGTETSGYSVEIHPSDSLEVDNEAAISKIIATDGTVQRHSLPGGDVDWISFSLSDPADTTISIIATNPYELEFSLYGPDSSTLYIADASIGDNTDSAQIRLEGASHLLTGTYYVEVSSWLIDSIDRYSLAVDAIPVPEPSGTALLVSGIAGLGVLSSCRKRRVR